jgi:hypothetical protein
MEGSMRCPECGAELLERDRFCFSCGASVEASSGLPQENLLRCSRCGEAVEEDDKFCSFCGNAIEKSRMIEPKEREATAATLRRNSYRRMIFLGYTNLLICSCLIIIGGLGLHELPRRFMDNDTGYFMMLWSTLGLFLGIGIFGGYFLSRKLRSAKRHGKAILVLSLIMIFVFFFAYIAATLRYN